MGLKISDLTSYYDKYFYRVVEFEQSWLRFIIGSLLCHVFKRQVMMMTGNRSRSWSRINCYCDWP